MTTNLRFHQFLSSPPLSARRPLVGHSERGTRKLGEGEPVGRNLTPLEAKLGSGFLPGPMLFSEGEACLHFH